MHEKQDETNILSIIFLFLQKYPEENKLPRCYDNNLAIA